MNFSRISASFPLQERSNLYGWFYIFSTPVLWILAYLVVLELYRLILEDYPGIASVGRKAVTWCMGLFPLLFPSPMRFPISEGRRGRLPIIPVYVIFERSTVLGLLLFLVLIQLFLVHYRLRLSPNRMVYATGYALYFAIVVAQDTIVTALGLRVVYSVNLWIVVAGGVVLLLGAALLRKKGEARVQLESTDSSAERARLQQQLSDINRLLSRAARGAPR